jgi:hypothetical protein
MSDRICPCGKEFKYPYLLLRHQNSIYCNFSQHCTKSTNHEDNHDNKFLCEHCEKNYATKFSLKRHEKNCKLKDAPTSNCTNDIYLLKQLEVKDKQLQESEKEKRYYMELYIKNLKETYEARINDLTKLMSKELATQDLNSISNQNPIQIPNQNSIPNIEVTSLDYILGKAQNYEPVQNNQPNKTNHQNQTTNNQYDNTKQKSKNIKVDDGNAILGNQEINTNNGTITTNNINITNITTIQNNVPFVYPFGYENISFLTNKEILDILKSPDGARLVLEKIYSNIENNNFMKLNKKDKQLSYIASPKNIKFCNDKEFIMLLYTQAKNLLDRIFFQCYPNLSNEHQLIVWENVSAIKESLNEKSEYIDNNCMNLIASKVNNNEAKRIYKEIKNKIETNDKKIITKITQAKQNIENEIFNMQDNMAQKKINLNEIKNNIWGNIMEDESMEFEKYENNLNLQRYENTYRYNKMRELNKLENDQIIAAENITIGDLEAIIAMKRERNNNELLTIQQTYSSLCPEYNDEINNTLINKPRIENKVNLECVKLKKNKKTIMITNNI